MFNKELLLRLRKSLCNKALEQGREVSAYIKRKAEIIADDVQQNAYLVLGSDTKETIDTLMSMYEDQVTLRASIQMLDGLLAELPDDEGRVE